MILGGLDHGRVVDETTRDYPYGFGAAWEGAVMTFRRNFIVFMVQRTAGGEPSAFGYGVRAAAQLVGTSLDRLAPLRPTHPASGPEDWESFLIAGHRGGPCLGGA